MRTVLIVFVVFLIISCNSRKVSQEEFYSSISEEPFVLRKTEGDFTYEIRYLPPEFFALRDISAENISGDYLQKEKFKIARKSYENASYFQVRIHRNDNSDFVKDLSGSVAEYNLKQEFLQNQMHEDLFIDADGKHIYPAHYQYSKTYGLSHDLDFIYVFPSDLPEHIDLIFKDRFTAYPSVREFRFSFDLRELKEEFLIEELI